MVFDGVLIYLRELKKKLPDDLLGHRATCLVWRWFEDLPIYRTVGEPCALFTSVVYGNDDDGDQEIRVHGLGIARSPSDLKDAAFEATIRKRCRSLGL
jgi:hypothetical protein